MKSLNWQFDYEFNSNDSALSVARVIEVGSESHPQGPLVIANLNVGAFAPHMHHVDRHGALMAAAPQMERALSIIIDRLTTWFEFEENAVGIAPHADDAKWRANRAASYRSLETVARNALPKQEGAQ